MELYRDTCKGVVPAKWQLWRTWWWPHHWALECPDRSCVGSSVPHTFLWKIPWLTAPSVCIKLESRTRTPHSASYYFLIIASCYIIMQMEQIISEYLYSIKKHLARKPAVGSAVLFHHPGNCPAHCMRRSPSWGRWHVGFLYDTNPNDTVRAQSYPVFHHWCNCASGVCSASYGGGGSR